MLRQLDLGNKKGSLGCGYTLNLYKNSCVEFLLFFLSCCVHYGAVAVAVAVATVALWLWHCDCGAVAL